MTNHFSFVALFHQRARTFIFSSAVLSLLGGLCLAPNTAKAAPINHHHPIHHHQQLINVPAAIPDKCIPLCVKDDLPCDPIYFKQADGRCNFRFD